MRSPSTWYRWYNSLVVNNLEILSLRRQIRKYFKYQIFGIILYVKYNQKKKMTFSSKALILFFKKEFSFSESLSLFLMSSYAVTRAKCEATDSSPEYPESGVTISLLWAFSWFRMQMSSSTSVSMAALETREQGRQDRFATWTLRTTLKLTLSEGAQGNCYKQSCPGRNPRLRGWVT